MLNEPNPEPANVEGVGGDGGGGVVAARETSSGQGGDGRAAGGGASDAGIPRQLIGDAFLSQPESLEMTDEDRLSIRRVKLKFIIFN